MNIYVLSDNGALYNPSLQATILAKYSRSPESAIKIAQQLSVEEADKFHSKWTISYGHSSVAELAVLPVCFEGVSMVASKFIEKHQRGAYSEKSTRYQRFSRESFINPVQSKTMSNFINRFYDAYDNFYPIVLKNAATIMNEDPSKAKVKARAFDAIRYMLPAGTGTNLAAVLNLRDIRYLITEAKHHPNPEIKSIGNQVYDAASQFCPTLLGNTDSFYSEPTFINTNHSLSDGLSGVKVRSYTPEATEKFRSILKDSYGMSWESLEAWMMNRGNNKVPDIFKFIDIELEITMDYGAFRDIQRHRRCTQYNELLTPFHGYSIPDDFEGTELKDKYCSIMEQIKSYDDPEIVNDPHLLQYIVPMGYHHRSIFKMDLAELYYICELRTKPQGHISYRRIAYEMFEKANEVFPELMKWCNVVRPDKIEDHN